MSKKIAFLLYSLDGGGVERMTIHLAEAFVQKGYVVDLIVVNYTGDYLNEVPPEVRVQTFNKKKMSACFLELCRYLRREKPNYLVSAKDYINVIAIMAKLVARVRTKVIVSCRVNLTEQVHHEPKKFKRIRTYVKYTYQKADEIVAVSKGVASDIQEITGVPKEKIHVIYNPVVSDKLIKKAEEPVAHPWFQEQKTVIVSVGRLHKQKDYPTLLRAFQSVFHNKPATRLLFIGDGPEEEELRALSRQLEIESVVDFVGFQTNPYPYMRQASLFVLSSGWEGFGNVLVEALAVGCPVVSTNCPSGPSEILENGIYGELVPVRDANKLAKAMVHTLGLPRNEALLKKRANEFTIDQCVQKYEVLLN
ncbi:glycosyltransferase [Alkalihalophilus sp. As8PL]|uniref:Glycosyltransferase n=1 Tax=Alkalihalophilus sp. As8PL TaxID=3237103 RepID=A0AB39BPP1_9BACI